MKIPKVISKNNHEYIFVKQCNERVYLYKDMLYGYMECFTEHDLGLIEDSSTIMEGFKDRISCKIQEVENGYI